MLQNFQGTVLMGAFFILWPISHLNLLFLLQHMSKYLYQSTESYQLLQHQIKGGNSEYGVLLLGSGLKKNQSGQAVIPTQLSQESEEQKVELQEFILSLLTHVSLRLQLLHLFYIKVIVGRPCLNISVLYNRTGKGRKEPFSKCHFVLNTKRVYFC